MSYSINIPEGSDWSMQTVKLDGKMYNIELKYKARTQRWYLTLSDTEGNVLLTEKKCVPGQTLTGLYGIPDFGGNLYVQHSYGKEVYPSHDNFGQDKEFELLYFTDAEYTALLSMNFGGVLEGNQMINQNPGASAVKESVTVTALASVKKNVQRTSTVLINELFSFSTTYADYDVVIVPATGGTYDAETGRISIASAAPSMFHVKAQHKTDSTIFAVIEVRTIARVTNQQINPVNSYIYDAPKGSVYNLEQLATVTGDKSDYEVTISPASAAKYDDQNHKLTIASNAPYSFYIEIKGKLDATAYKVISFTTK